MASIKVTFTVDPPTVARLRDAALRLGKPKSEVFREAIRDFHERIGRLSESERLRLLRAFDELVPKIPPRSQAAVHGEIREIRRARRTAGSRSTGKRRG